MAETEESKLFTRLKAVQLENADDEDLATWDYEVLDRFISNLCYEVRQIIADELQAAMPKIQGVYAIGYDQARKNVLFPPAPWIGK